MKLSLLGFILASGGNSLFVDGSASRRKASAARSSSRVLSDDVPVRSIISFIEGDDIDHSPPKDEDDRTPGDGYDPSGHAYDGAEAAGAVVLDEIEEEERRYEMEVSDLLNAEPEPGTEDGEEDIDRRLAEDYLPLDCNTADIMSGDTCTDTVSALLVEQNIDLSTSTSPLSIPSCKCYLYDLGENDEVTIAGGIQVFGHLKFPDSYNTTIITPAVAVQGKLSISHSKPVSPESASLNIVLTGDSDYIFKPVGHEVVNLGKQAVVALGGSFEISGLPTDCPTWAKIKAVGSGIILDDQDGSLSSCWGVGSTIHITSSSFDAADGIDVTIQNIASIDDGADVSLEGIYPSLLGIITEAESTEFAVEAILKDRNVKIQGSNAGYLQVSHTVQTSQIIDGVEFNGMGQAQVNHRFPIELLYSGSIPGTVISRNSIVGSSNRCISIEGTSDVVIKDNTAAHTDGACYFVGYNAEHNNFVNNIAADTKRGNQFNNHYHDHEGPSYAIYFPKNNFTGNVAAGGNGYGFFGWLSHYTRNENYGYSSLGNPRRFHSGLFVDNVAHSYERQGFDFRSYEQGLNANKEGMLVIDSSRSYRNKGRGAYFEWLQGLVLKNVLVADNHIGIELVYSDDITMENTDIRGFTPVTQSATTSAQWKLCYNQRMCVGLRTPTRLIRSWAGSHGLTQTGTTFSGFDFAVENGCTVRTHPYSFADWWHMGDRHFDYTTKSSGMQVDAGFGQIANFCEAKDYLVDDVILFDEDGSLDPSKSATGHSVLVSDVEKMTLFSECQSVADQCFAYCPDQCLRTLSYIVEHHTTSNMVLQVTREDGLSYYVTGKVESEDHSYEWTHRRFTLSLPANDTYTTQFFEIDGNKKSPAWPIFAMPRWENSPSCNSVEIDNVLLDNEVSDAEIQSICSNIVPNGDMESGVQHWKKNSHVVSIEQKTGGAQNSGHYLAQSGRTSDWHYLGTHLDTRCAKQSHVEYYELQAFFRVESAGTGQDCSPYVGVGSNRCPQFAFKYEGHNDENKEQLFTDYVFGGRIVVPYEKDEWNEIHHVIKVADTNLAVAERIFLYLEHAQRNSDVLLDNVSVRKYTPPSASSCTELIQNGKFEVDGKWWWSWGQHARLDTTVGIDGGNDRAMKAYNRKGYSDSPRQDMFAQCVNGGDRIIVTAKYKLQKNGIDFNCNKYTWDYVERCSDVVMFQSKSGLGDSYVVLPTVEVSDTYDLPAGWNLVKYMYTFPYGYDEPNKSTLYFDGGTYHDNAELIVDDVSAVVVPQDCSNLILNGNFEDGTASFWTNWDRPYSKLKLVSGAAGVDDYALASYDRVNQGQGMKQSIDARCFSLGAQYEIKGKFKLVEGMDDNNAGSGGTCNVRNRYDSDSCPRVRFRFHECSGARTEYWVSVWNDLDWIEWDKDNFNDFHASFKVDDQIASCKAADVIINNVDHQLAVVVDDLSIKPLNTQPFPPTSDMIEDEDDLIVPPTPAPTTLAPTLSSATPCPPAGTTSAIDAGITLLGMSADDVLCTLTKVDGSTGKMSPIARSYEGNDWEMAGGTFVRTLLGSKSWQCHENSCGIFLPALEGDDFYQLSSYSHDIPMEDKVARLLESTTFGPTWEEIGNWTDFSDKSVGTYILSQMDTEITSHREYFRQRLNPRFHFSQHSATPNHPCRTNSRWRKFAFTGKDAYTHWTTETVKFELVNNAYVIYAAKKEGNDQGNYFARAVVNDFAFETGIGGVTVNADHTFCWGGLEEKVGGAIHLMLGNSCRRARNPDIDFTDNESLLPKGFINLGSASQFKQIDVDLSNGDELIYTGSGLSGALCDELTHHIDEVHDPPVFGKLDDGTWLQFDPRLHLQDNIPDSPIPDGGASLKDETGGVTQCANVPRSVFNDESCILASSESCSAKGNLVCGSEGEVGNDPAIGSFFDIATGRDTTHDLSKQREQTWTNIALQAKDQLRQRVAHALSQIIVMVKDAISASVQSESFLTYYDIFVRHAFGNYRDILNHVSFSSLMGENLSYRSSKSAAYMRRHSNQLEAFPDENYAREFMQLFTIGVYQLNLDGSVKIDESGEPLYTYSNDEIMSFARAWTGFERHSFRRGNVEDTGGWGDHIDPMKIEPSWRDTSPKNDVLGGYIGDGYPLCEDLPDKMFLKPGATYRFLGSSNLSELGGQDDPRYATDDTVLTLSLDENSQLRTLLCKEEGGACQYANSVTLETDLTSFCVGKECLVDTVRVVEVEGMFYEYIRVACVEQAFYNGAVKLSQQNRDHEAICANPSLPVASGACCSINKHDSISYWNVGLMEDQKYDGERTSYATAEARCSAISKTTCDYDYIELDYAQHFKLGFHWTDEPCKIRVKVDELGNVASVHLPSDLTQNVVQHVDKENNNFFKVYWENELFPSVGLGCGGCEVVNGGCVCDADVRKTKVFNSNRLPRTVDEVKANLFIGAVDPRMYFSSYTSSQVSETDITIYNEGATIEANSIFGIIDDTGREIFYKNTRETVHLQDAEGVDINHSFRNAPHFMSIIPKETASRDAHYETQAVIDHFFYHSNTAPFIAYRIIQRFAISNPSPRYISTVASAFRRGEYSFGEQTFGSGNYGCLNATIAATLLDREARSVILDADPSHGSLREPLLKVIGLMRSLNFEAANTRPAVKFNDMATTIGMMAHDFPTVFGFYLPSYKPTGPVGDADLVSPESLLLDMAKNINILNGMFSLARYGLSSCRHGFGYSIGWHSCDTIGDFEQSSGRLTYTSIEGNATAYTDRLATLLTAGRLSQESRQIINEASKAVGYVNAAEGEPNVLIHALTLLLTTPEFHSNNLAKKSGSVRDSYRPPEPTGNSYKALVYIMLSGGCDSYNILVPHTCNNTDAFYNEYAGERRAVALSRDSLRLIDAEGQVCEKFGLHTSLPNIHKMYQEDKDLLFFANTGVITKPSTKDNYWQNTKTALFGHDSMQREAKRVNPYDRTSQTGVFGRMADSLTADGYNFGSFSIDWHSEALVGEPGRSPAPSTVSQRGTNSFNTDSPAKNMLNAISDLNEATQADSGVFGEQWSSEMLHSLAKNDELHEELKEVKTATEFPNNHLGRQLEMVSRLIATRETRGVDRDLFFVQMGGFDTHHENIDSLVNLFEQLDSAVGSFAEEMKELGVWDKVTTVQLSDFARTLVPNSGDGTDHGWGGNYMMFGGDVQGGQIKGHYPDNLTSDGPVTLDRGRFIPTTAWDSVFKAVAEWYGVGSDKIDDICPNAYQFENVTGYSNFKLAELFGSDVAEVRRLRKRKSAT